MYYKYIYIIIALFISSLFDGTVRAGEPGPGLYFEKSIPSQVMKQLSRDGYSLAFKRKTVATNVSGVHYLLLVQDGGGGCGVADFDVEKSNYKFIDSYGRCKIVGPPTIKDLFGDGAQQAVVRLELHSNGPDDGDVVQTNAYLYVKASSEFCRNDDAGSFANGTRVPNSVIKFGPSICR